MLEYIELYNPTTFPITINSANFRLVYVNPDGNEINVPLTFVNNIVPANGGYFLIASTPVVRIPGIGPVSANARYNPVNLSPAGIDSTRRGGIIIFFNNVRIDSLAWGAKTGANTPPTSAVETRGYDFPGFPDTKQDIGTDRSLERKSDVYSQNQIGSGNQHGNAYDSDKNSRDFGYNQTATNLTPQNTSFIENPISGKPVANAFVFAFCDKDDISSHAVSRSAPPGQFDLLDIATGTWRLEAVYGNLCGTRTIVITEGSPATMQHIILNRFSEVGYIKGRVVSTGKGLTGIIVSAGARQARTDRAGYYRLSLFPGEYEVTANPNNINIDYTSEKRTVTVHLGAVVTGVDFILYPGGSISGRVRNLNRDPLPYVLVEARNSANNIIAIGVTDHDGYFTISNLRNITYTVRPILEKGESSDPLALENVRVSQGRTVWATTFTVTNSMGKFRGKVEYNNERITTGVIIVASTDTTLSPNYPPPITNSITTAGPHYFMTTSNEKGTYELPVIGYGPEINYRLIAWYTHLEGNRLVTRSRTVSAWVAPEGTREVDFTGSSSDWQLLD